MIISHKYRYLFIEIPLTGSWAIHHELCNYYGGEPILHKHASYPEFARIASQDERSYFVFATVRNPLDKAVSSFFKLKTDHKGAFSDPETLKSLKVDYVDLKRFQFIRASDATFDSYFLRSNLWNRPYSDMIELSSEYLDYVIGFENLQEDFSEVLRRLEIRQVRPVPVTNKTKGRRASWETYYSPRTYEKAKKVFGPAMKKWGYDFPESWGAHRVTWFDQGKYLLVNEAKKFYHSRFRYNESAFARFIRRLRAQIGRVT